MSKILVVGYTSKLGSVITEALLQTDHSIIGTFNTKASERARNDIERYQLDVTYPASVINMMHALKPDIVIYCPALFTRSDNCIHVWQEHYQVNLQGPVLIQNVLRQNKGQLITLDAEQDFYKLHVAYGALNVARKNLAETHKNWHSLLIPNIHGGHDSTMLDRDLKIQDLVDCLLSLINELTLETS